MDNQEQGVKNTTNQIQIQKLIELVEKRPLIWDKNAEGYRNKELCNKAWKEICMALVDAFTYDGWNEQERILAGNQLKSKWTSLRDGWQKTHKRQREALLNGSTCDIKDIARHESLTFLSKVYDGLETSVDKSETNKICAVLPLKQSPKHDQRSVNPSREEPSTSNSFSLRNNPDRLVKEEDTSNPSVSYGNILVKKEDGIKRRASENENADFIPKKRPAKENITTIQENYLQYLKSYIESLNDSQKSDFLFKELEIFFKNLDMAKWSEFTIETQQLIKEIEKK